MSNRFKVVMLDYSYDSLHFISDKLAEFGADFFPYYLRSEDEVIEKAADADAVILEYFDPVSRRVIESLKQCKAIARTGIGVNTIDVAAATDHNIPVINVPAYCLDEVSDHTMALLLACARRLKRLDRAISQNHVWDFKMAKPAFGLRGQKLGIIGFGKIANRLAPKARAFGMEILAYDPYVEPNLIYASLVKPVNFEELLAESDFVTIHCPLTDETEGMIDESALRAMKPTAYLINAARGPIVDEAALHTALSEGWIAGAGLDNMIKEPPDWDNPLLDLENVIFTPHVAFYSERSLEELLRTAATYMCRVLTGHRPSACVNPEVLDRLDLK